jgi:aspartate/methionine/tyrosine aminotransferase
MKKVMHDLGDPYWSNVELISMHSVSKGLLGECGLRGGYAECVNFSPKAKEMMYKLKSINLCSNTIGQIATGLMCDEPIRGVVSDECMDLYES